MGQQRETTRWNQDHKGNCRWRQSASRIKQTSHLREKKERCKVGVHDVGQLFRRVVDGGLANAGAHVVNQNVQKSAEMFFRLGKGGEEGRSDANEYLVVGDTASNYIAPKGGKAMFKLALSESWRLGV